jgi:hypothetical protein
MSGTLAKDRSCRILQKIAGYDQCEGEVSFKVEFTPEFPS